jgi:hypothetical protein
MSRPRHAVVDFLQKHDIGATMAERVDDSLGTVAPVESSDSLVDIICDQMESHADSEAVRVDSRAGDEFYQAWFASGMDNR